MRLNRQPKHVHPTDGAQPSKPSLRLVPVDPVLAAERRMRAAGGPQDSALYRCGCGFVFDAPVSTTVNCPHCSTTLAW